MPAVEELTTTPGTMAEPVVAFMHPAAKVATGSNDLLGNRAMNLGTDGGTGGSIDGEADIGTGGRTGQEGIELKAHGRSPAATANDMAVTLMAVADVVPWLLVR